jgi:hypothetical protein
MKVVPVGEVPAGSKTMEDLRKLFEGEPIPPGSRTTTLYPRTPNEAWNPAVRPYEGGRKLDLRTDPRKGTASIFVHVQLIDESRVPEIAETSNLYIWERHIPYDMEVLDYVATKADITTDCVFIVDEGLNRT